LCTVSSISPALGWATARRDHSRLRKTAIVDQSHGSAISQQRCIM
jgi:hypothetical protein